MLARLDEYLPHVVLVRQRLHVLDLEVLLDAAGHVDERVARVTTVQVLIGQAQLGVGLLQQRRPELVRLLTVAAEDELVVVAVHGQAIVNNHIHPFAIRPETVTKKNKGITSSKGSKCYNTQKRNTN